MTLKQIISLAVALVLGLVVNNIVGLLVTKATQERNTYRVNGLPPYAMTQDLQRPRSFIALVRLETSKNVFFCSGTVISDDYVLTAAHCLMDHESVFPGMTKDNINVVSVENEAGETTTVKGKAVALSQGADYALIQGDFQDFGRLPIAVSPTAILAVEGPIVTCGFPHGAKSVCYPAVGRGQGLYYDKVYVNGYLFPGMSGGPTVDLSTKTIFAINMATMPQGILLSPLIGIFETLGITVTP